MPVRCKKPSLGPMFGYTTQESTIVWIRGRRSQKAVLRYRIGENNWQYDDIPLHDNLDFIGIKRIDFNGEQQEVSVQVTLVAEHQTIEDPSTLSWSNSRRTAKGSCRPAPDPNSGFTFLSGSCSHKGYGLFRRGQEVYKRIESSGDSQSDFMMLMGDQVYCDHPGTHGLNILPAWIVGQSKPQRVQGYFRKYRSYYRQKHFQKLMGQMPTFRIFDDHEIENNWKGYLYDPNCDGQEGYKNSKTLLQGLTAYLAYQDSMSGSYQRHFAEADEIDGLRQCARVLDPERTDQWQEKPEHWGYEFSWGLADFLVLDVRSERTDPNQAGANILRDEGQYHRLIEFLKQGDGQRYKFVVSPVPLAPDINADARYGENEEEVPDNELEFEHDDTWRSYPEQRKRLLDKIRTCPEITTMPIFLSGDIHLSNIVEIKRRDDEENFALPCLISSAINWIVFGVQPVSDNEMLLPKLEDGPLLESRQQLRDAPADREDASEYRVEFFEFKNEEDHGHLSYGKRTACTRNNYMKINVDEEGVTAEIIQANGERFGRPWFRSRESLQIVR
ncbi:alkaline phosphatase D family protein [Pseudoteredinibacter isoporae]|uniref:Phosphodiesterase/alkaline phosphatase D-like protein n=1 Tax=Pseudoteredinibacter isoporae TaxID=570281 RepID=A0A7X0JRE5_9GAMM|nr:alkaline phosphatase D family protein [Pseudoteredinibacter isoporae]MBB6520001.1 phosphodiesterase/alkaline phosphatase D-like protein [Pseudoteredinibacter isoporae]NHO85573.1 alkaline phosphatase family protein [Pseudoteredinibacter isoporae]NIB25975.1 alkaline phosphatase family protein [Pseudoteredinibacter isoporae]